jgi:hypothetical protein
MKYFTGFALSLAIAFFAIIIFHESLPGNDKISSNLITNNWPNVVIPQNLSFAGEKVPLQYFDVKEDLDKELLAVANWHSRTFLLLKRANRSFPVIERILKQNGIPEDFKYLAVAESGLINDISPVGAQGVWQFMDKTAIEYGLEVNNDVDERYNLEKSTDAACQYLKKSYAKFGNWSLVAAAYNMGSAALDRKMTEQKQQTYWDLALNTETARYLYRILAIKLIFENSPAYGYVLKPSDLYPIIETRSVSVDTSVSNWVNFSLSQGSTYKMLKYFNPWLRTNSLDNKNKKTYIIEFPKENARDKVY